MRKLALLLLLSGIAWPMRAAKPVTVEQLEQLLIAAHGERDGKVAGHLSSLELTERASPAALSRWEADFPGRRAREALVALADASAFLNLPPAEILAIAPPNLIAQQMMFSRTIDYVIETIPKLPNFFATRVTTHFENTLFPLNIFPRFEYLPLHVVGRSSVTVIYRNGHETVAAGTTKRKRLKPPARQLTTEGEFGPVLGVVIGDAVRGKITWSHWEQGASGPQAVFHYMVPQEKSHYSVTFPYNGEIERILPAYHGEITIDRAKGNILRLTIVSDLEPPYQMVDSDIMVEYGPVAIGGRTYICPTKAVALSRVPIFYVNEKLQIFAVPLQTFLNDILFEQYHVFRAESRILTGDSRILQGP